jgi:hypothetical protein
MTGNPAPAAADGDFTPLTVPLPHITSPRRAAITRCRTRATNLPLGGTRAFAGADLEPATL